MNALQSSAFEFPRKSRRPQKRRFALPSLARPACFKSSRRGVTIMRKRFVSAQSSAAALRTVAVGLGLVICMLGLGLSANAQDGKHGTFVTFDVPGDVCGTVPVGIT